MATATLISLSTLYPAHPPSLSSTYQPPPGAPISNMISPVEPRRMSDENDSPHRQSLPSIREVISGTKQPTSYPPPPTTVPPSQSFSSPFPSAAPPRSFSDTPSDKDSPRSIQPASTFPPRPEPPPAFPEQTRPQFGGRPAPPLNAFPGQHPSPPIKSEQQHPHEADQRPPEGPQANGTYAHPPPPPAPLAYSAPGHLPPGQLPLSAAYPISPRRPGAPALPSPFDAQRPPQHPEEPDYGQGRTRYDSTVNRHFEVWAYQECLNRIATSSRTIYSFADAYARVTQEQHGPQPIPERLPSQHEVAEMLSNLDCLKKSLENIREIVHHNAMSERARETGKAKGQYEDQDVPMYGEPVKPAYIGEGVKKRRGRAAPPGRCHSCNRMDTPEWRRGPDGARTLCNACGLHYAKLERKRQHEARSLRPKPSDPQN